MRSYLGSARYFCPQWPHFTLPILTRILSKGLFLELITIHSSLRKPKHSRIMSSQKQHNPNHNHSAFQDGDHDWMKTDWENAMDHDVEYDHTTKRMKAGATTGQHDGPVPIVTAFVDESDVNLHHTTGSKPSFFQLPVDSLTHHLIQDAKNPVSEVSSKGHKAGLLFSQITIANLPETMEGLHQKYLFSALNFGAKSQFNHNVNVAALLLRQNSMSDDRMKPTVVVLAADLEQAKRMLAVGEKVKADIAAEGGHWFQYTEMHNKLVTLEPRIEGGLATGKASRERDEEQKSKAGERVAEVTAKEVAEKDAARSGGEDAMDEGEDAFQTMERGRSAELPARLDPGKDKIRATPILTVYLARSHIPELSNLYGFVPPLLRFVTPR